MCYFCLLFLKMEKKLNTKRFKVEMVYEVYPSKYPPFKLFLDFIKQNSNLDIGISVFKNTAETPPDVYCMPNFYLRILLQRFFFWHSILIKLKYPEQFWFRKKNRIIHVQHSFLFHHVLNLLKLNIHSKPKIIISLVGGETYVKPWTDKRWTDFYSKYGNLVDGYTVQSLNQKEYITKWGIDKNKVFVIPVSFGIVSNANPKYPNSFKMKIISAFRMTWEKNIEGNIRFAKVLSDHQIPFEYHVYGHGVDLGQLFYLIDKFELQNKVIYKGYIENSELKKILPEYDFYLQLSISEALSASVIEAQSLGVPAIVSDSDGIKEAIIPNKTGICAPYYDLDFFVKETILLWNDKQRFYQFSTDAIEFANQNYSLQKELERTIAMYNSILATCVDS